MTRSIDGWRGWVGDGWVGKKRKAETATSVGRVSWVKQKLERRVETSLQEALCLSVERPKVTGISRQSANGLGMARPCANSYSTGLGEGHSSTRRAVPMGRQVRLGRCVRARAGGGECPGGSEGVCGWLAQVAKVDGSKSDFSLGGDDSRPPIITIVHQPRFIIDHKRSRQNNTTMPLYDTTLSTLSNTPRYSSSDSSPDSSTSIASATVTSNPGSWSTPM